MLDGRFEYRPYYDIIYIWVNGKQVAKFKPSEQFFELLDEANAFAVEAKEMRERAELGGTIKDIEDYLGEEKNLD